MLDIAELREMVTDPPKAAGLPLRELATAGFEMLIERCLALDLADVILDHPAYLAHLERRAADGLAA